ncbi:hypothetical protein ACPUEN_15310 [Algoriphagus yeomjeoni]|uniref:hypothetical protein n=1 Tax=Algoriphagus yeomjeoni TaxID=291403 RepID=UPI003CE5B577
MISEPLPKARPVKAQNAILGIETMRSNYRVPKARSVSNTIRLAVNEPSQKINYDLKKVWD